MSHFQPPRWLTTRTLGLQLALLALPIAILLSPGSAYAADPCSGNRDYGDAPSSYGIACATPSATLRIGNVSPDTESASQFSTGATGDDTSGTDDETFLNPLTPIDLANAQYIWTVLVVNTTGANATLAGWIDFNNNGTFEASERTIATVANGATSATLTWNIPITAQPDVTTYARLRISTDANVGPVDDYPAAGGLGEVEDYAVPTVQSEVCAPGTSFYFIALNGGDSTINTFDVSNGSSTLVNNPVTLGYLNGLAVDRWRGLVYYQDGGTPTSRGLYYYDVVNNANGTVTSDASTGPLNLPLTNGWTTASAAYANNRYYAGIDGGDLGTIYEITLNAAGTGPVSARPLITPNAPPCGQTFCNDYGDIIVVGNRLFVSFWSAGSGTQTQHLDVYDINSLFRLSTWSAGYPYDGNNAWAFQLGRDGNGQIYAVRQDNGNIYTVDAVAGTIGSTSLGSTGGIVTDASECPLVTMDFGDAPNSYGTTAGARAARHLLVANLRLGTVPTQPDIRDLHGFPSVNANGDDQNNYNGSVQGGTDDEDALAANPATIDATQTSYTISNITVFNNTGTAATLYGWIDFNRDGLFQQSERVTVAVPSNPNPQTVSLTWSNLTGLVNGVSYLRLRLSTAATTISTLGTGNDGAFLATGYAANGEVEDYPVLISGATAVRLTSFGIGLSEGQTIAEMAVIPGLFILLVGAIAGLGTWRWKFRRA